MKIKISKHNLPVVEKIVDSYHSGTRSILYTSGVGTGKSYVFMGIVERMLQELKSILYVIPKYAVQETSVNIRIFSGSVLRFRSIL